jgi:hypothetical protein
VEALSETLSGEELRAKYEGQFRATDAGMALRLLGLRDQIHPDDVAAFIYTSREVQDAFAQGNLEHNGSPTYGPVMVDCGLLSVVDMRSQMAEHDCPPTDPALPDHWWKV